jgi:hypothetical protein
MERRDARTIVAETSLETRKSGVTRRKVDLTPEKSENGVDLGAHHLPDGGRMFTIGEFKGNVVITLKRDDNDRYPFSFGLSKAKMILEHLEDIRKFYEEYKDKPRTAAAGGPQHD